MNNTPRPITLLILDGWGYREETTANAIAAAHTPTFDALWKHYPHTLLGASSCNVGLPKDQMGNSEVGHLNLGAGRIIHQNLSRITNAIETGDFFHNSILIDAIDHAIQNDKAIHILGLLSPGGIHSHEEHIHALIKLAAKQHATKVYIHAFLDGRDMPPKSAASSIQHLEDTIKTSRTGKIVSLIGRYYAMDRDQRWDRVEMAYDLLTHGLAIHTATSASEGLQIAYDAGETDEFVKSTSIHEPQDPPITINSGDSVIFMNFRADRAREITRTFTETNFQGFHRKKTMSLGRFVSLTEYNKNFAIPVAFPPQSIVNTLGEYLSKQHKKQLRLAETEKYAHVTFFLNGGIETPFEGEDRLLVPSPKVSTYDLQPEMSAIDVTKNLVEAIHSQTYDVIICNYANPDMVGHTGNMEATIQAVECIDGCLEHIIHALQSTGGEVIITADHGNAELMFDPKTNQPHTAHTCNPVPFIYVGRPAIIKENIYALCDIAPTILYLMELPVPKEMTGKSIVEIQEG